MKPVFIDFDYNSHISLYVQLYDYLKRGILSREIKAGERLPSLRALSGQIGVSITTCSRAYDQLLVEGYIDAKPQSGYYVNDLDADWGQVQNCQDADRGQTQNEHFQEGNGGIPTDSADKMHEFALSQIGHGGFTASLSAAALAGIGYYSDSECFDFGKWRKCAAGVMTDHIEDLLIPADPQGEYALRLEISRYLYRARGVAAAPEQIVISAGVQQLTNHLARILRYMGIDLVNVENPGYKPVQHIFRDRGFTINKIPVRPDGIEIERLPVNLESAVYVSPSNQFPTGSVMPAARRYSLLKWAADNGSIIIEDDYDSELRYFGSPLPALKSIDAAGAVVYLGSFSSTLFPAIRLSYMVLPEKLAAYFDAHKTDYDQTCSKIEQLTLALFMSSGFYQQGIRRIRKLYARKLSLVIQAFKQYGEGLARAENTNSGISIRLTVTTSKPSVRLCQEAASLRLHMLPFEDDSEQNPDVAAAGNSSATFIDRRLIFYYDQIPEDAIDPAIRELCDMWTHF